MFLSLPLTVVAMQEIDKRQLAVYVAAAIAIALIGARYLKESARSSPPARASASAARLRVDRPSARVVVHVTGAVRRPGVYRLPSWGRLDLAVRRAGGPAQGADLEGVNLASKVADGQQVVVPRRGSPGAAVAGVGAGVGAGGAAPSQPVSLNTATAEQLDELEGIGPMTAQKILEWRTQHGGFRSVDDLKQIGGIGPKRFASLKDKVRM
jgi:competence protein ComEA